MVHLLVFFHCCGSRVRVDVRGNGGGWEMVHLLVFFHCCCSRVRGGGGG